MTPRETTSHLRRRPSGRRAAVWIGAAVGALTVAACGGVNIRDELGLVVEGPDEFRVVRNGDLIIPSDLPASADELPEPTPGAPSLVEPRPLEDAAAALGGFDPNSGAGAPSDAEAAILAAAGADSVDPSIRDELEADQEALLSQRRILDGLLGTDRSGGAALDADAEARRLAEEAQQTVHPELEIPPADE